MVAGRWEIDQPVMAEYTTPGHPLSSVNLRCGLCGRQLGTAGWPQGEHMNEIRSVLLEEGLKYVWHRQCWVPTRRLIDQVTRFRRQLSGEWADGRKKRNQEWVEKKTRRGVLRRKGYRDLASLRATGGRYPLGVVGKMESRMQNPRWEVELPAKVVCVECRKENLIQPFTPAPDKLFCFDSAGDAVAE